MSIVSDRDPKVYNSFLGEFLVSHGDTVDDEQTFHPRMDNQSEMTIDATSMVLGSQG